MGSMLQCYLTVGGPQGAKQVADVVVAHKNTVRRWIEKIADATGQEVTKSHAQELALTVRQVGEGGVIGAVLGAVDGSVGLDVRGVPMDLALAGAGSAAAMYFAKEDFSHDVRNIASHSFTVFTFRKTKELMEMKDQPGYDGMIGEEEEEEESTDDVGEEDPVVAAARDL